MVASWLAVETLWQRELVRFWRQKSRVLGVVASPLIFWANAEATDSETSSNALARRTGSRGAILFRNRTRNSELVGPETGASAMVSVYRCFASGVNMLHLP